MEVERELAPEIRIRLQVEVLTVPACPRSLRRVTLRPVLLTVSGVLGPPSPRVPSLVVVALRPVRVKRKYQQPMAARRVSVQRRKHRPATPNYVLSTVNGTSGLSGPPVPSIVVVAHKLAVVLLVSKRPMVVRPALVRPMSRVRVEPLRVLSIVTFRCGLRGVRAHLSVAVVLLSLSLLCLVLLIQ